MKQAHQRLGQMMTRMVPVQVQVRPLRVQVLGQALAPVPEEALLPLVQQRRSPWLPVERP